MEGYYNRKLTMIKILLLAACLAIAAHSQMIRLGLPQDLYTPNNHLSYVHQVTAPSCQQQPARPVQQQQPPPIQTPACQQPPLLPLPQPLPLPLPLPQPVPIQPPACQQPLKQLPPILLPQPQPQPQPQPHPLPQQAPPCHQTPVKPPQQLTPPPSQPTQPKLCSCGHHEVAQPVKTPILNSPPIIAQPSKDKEHDDHGEHEERRGKVCNNCGGKDCKCQVHNPPEHQPKPILSLIKENGKTCDKCKDGKCECSDCKCDNCKKDKDDHPIKPVLQQCHH